MRVIAGEKRHLLLKTLEGLDIRPTTDKIKETLFNMIQWDIPDARFLDLFAGSGAIGIEALSRGAKDATFIDNNTKAIKVIEENIDHTGLKDKSRIIKGDVPEIIENQLKGYKYDIIFMDPPYEDIGIYKKTLNLIHDTNLCNTNAKVILEASKDFDNTLCDECGFDIIKEKIYKSNKHIFLKIRR